MCRKVLHVYDFPLHHISYIRIFHLIVIWSIRKHWVLKNLYTRLLVIIIGSISWSSKSVRSLWIHMASHIECYILCFCGTQGHKVLFHVALGNHGKLHSRTSTGCVFWSNVLSAQSKSAYPTNSSSHWRHILGHIQLCLIYISIHSLLLSSESISIDSWID